MNRDQNLPGDCDENCRMEDDLLDVDELEIPECHKFENLFLISKMLGKSVPLKRVSSKIKADWMPTGEIKYVDMVNRVILIEFANEMDCNYAFFNQLWFVQGQILNL